MTENTNQNLFPDTDTQTPQRAAGQTHAVGILPAHGIANMIRDGQIWAGGGIDDDQIQPASLDLRLAETAYRVRASFLPGASGSVMDKIGKLAYHKVDLRQGAVLETGCVYLVPLMEALALPERTAGFANPKSSTGRIDVFTRLITDLAARLIPFRQVIRGTFIWRSARALFRFLCAPVRGCHNCGSGAAHPAIPMLRQSVCTKKPVW